MTLTKPTEGREPLTVRFALLPSMLPNGTLSPVLFSIWGIAVYRTLDPSPAASYVSISALSLALELPVIHLLHRFHLQPGVDYNMTLGGVAPWRDLWVTFAVARRIATKLGVGDLLGVEYDDTRPDRGLLALDTEMAVSWDDGGGGIAHNWLPPSSKIPLSSYSLAALSETAFPSIHVLANDRFVRTPLEHSTRKLLASHSRLEEDWTGLGRRRVAFHDVLELSVAAWEAFLRHPSVPKRVDAPRKSSNTTSASIFSLVQSLPKAIVDLDSRPAFPPSLHDIDALMRSATTVTTSKSAAVKQVLDLVLDDLANVGTLQRFLGTPRDRVAARSTRKLQTAARVQLTLAEALGWTLVAAWKAGGDVVDEAATLDSGEPGIDETPQVRTWAELEHSRGSSPLPRRKSRGSSPFAVNDVSLRSEEGAIWMWGLVTAFVAYCIWAGMTM